MTKDNETAAPAIQLLNDQLLSVGSEMMEPFSAGLETAHGKLIALLTNTDRQLAKKIARIKRTLDTFEPSVTLVGQVKAGKTALTNVLVGQIGLLPSDVNPWTSVVTSLHLNRHDVETDYKAKFQFFSREEWDSLVTGGGRLGELADRAGSSDELQSIREQIVEMQQQAQSRLGASFEALLGKVHKYGYCDRELTERYVCLGDPDELAEDPQNKQGRFADITRAADLYFSLPYVKLPICLRDTPGVNDTFLVREQITVNTLQDTDICLIVLSAHEALNTSDLALIRLISAMEHRKIVLFVNRIDELAKPSQQVPEIRKSITATLEATNAAENVSVLFGSAKWAEMALTGSFNRLDEDKKATLLDWAGTFDARHVKDSFTHVWMLSGLPDLLEALSERILEGPADRMLRELRAQCHNLMTELEAQTAIAEAHQNADLEMASPATALRQEIDALSAAANKKLHSVLEDLKADFHKRLEQVQDNYVARATEALVTHIKRFGEREIWTYSSSGLRLVLRATHKRFENKAEEAIREIFVSVAKEVELLYGKLTENTNQSLRIEPPTPPSFPAPVVLGKTIALDLNSSWWKKWWHRREGIESFAQDYSRLIRAEVGSMINDLEATLVAEDFREVEATLARFLSEQRETLLLLADRVASSNGDNLSLAKAVEVHETLQEIMDALDFSEEQLGRPKAPAKLAVGANQ